MAKRKLTFSGKGPRSKAQHLTLANYHPDSYSSAAATIRYVVGISDERHYSSDFDDGSEQSADSQIAYEERIRAFAEQSARLETAMQDDAEATEQLSTQVFHKLVDFPSEMRKKIYAYALTSDRPIKPHLCSAISTTSLRIDSPQFIPNSTVKFHDENQTDHASTFKLLQLTLVSKEIRRATLPIFYGANTFDGGADTIIYFEHLSHLGRFHMIRHVGFSIDTTTDPNRAVKTTQLLRQTLTQQAAYERDAYTHSSQPTTQTLDVLKQSPMHSAGGISWLGDWLVLLKLSSALPPPPPSPPSASPSSPELNADTESPYTRRLVLDVSHAFPIANLHSTQRWLAVAQGLGVQLHFVSGTTLEPGDAGPRIHWRQMYQKKDFEADRAAGLVLRSDVVPRWMAAAAAATVGRPKKMSYYRVVSCQGVDTQRFEWFDVVVE